MLKNVNIGISFEGYWLIYKGTCYEVRENP